MCRTSSLLFAATFFSLAGCGGDSVTSPPKVVVSVQPDSSELTLGASVRLAVTVTENGRTDTSAVVSWTSDNQSVATVDSRGEVTGVSPGQTTVRATSRGTVGVAGIVVFPVPILEQDFSRYSSTDDLRRSSDWYTTQAEQYVFLDTGVGFGASDRSMRYEWPDTSGWPTKGKDFTISMRQNFPFTDEFWIEVWMRFSDSFTVSGPADGNADYKTIFVHSVPDGTGRWSFKIASCCSSGVASSRAGVPNKLVWIGNGPEYSPAPGGPYFDGTWTGVRMHGKGGSLPHPFELWINRAESSWEQVSSHADVEDQDPTVTGGDFFLFGANMNQGSYGGMSTWWGRLRVWDQDPGW